MIIETNQNAAFHWFYHAITSVSACNWKGKREKKQITHQDEQNNQKD